MHPKSDLCQRQRKHSSRHLLIFRRTQLLRIQPENHAFQYASPDVATVRVHIGSKIFFVVHDPEGDPVRFQELNISLIDQKLSASKISSKNFHNVFSYPANTQTHTYTHANRCEFITSFTVGKSVARPLICSATTQQAPRASRCLLL